MQAFGRTPLTAVSPKKTWEGALVGLGGCIATSVLLTKVLSWPMSTLRYLVYFYVLALKSNFAVFVPSFVFFESCLVV